MKAEITNLMQSESSIVLEYVKSSKKTYITEDEYIIFISQPEDFNQSISLGDLLHCVVCSKDINAAEQGIPNEMVTYIDPPIVKVNMPTPCYKLNNVAKLYYILPAISDDPDLCISRTIIRALNGMLNVKLYVVAPLSVISLLEPIANNHIFFRVYTNDFWGMLTDCNILLGSQSIAINALLNQIPVIVIGSHGFGGLVTDDNIQNFTESGFWGRIGGSLKEKIPVAAILYEIQYVLDLLNFNHHKPLHLLSSNHIDLLAKAFVENGAKDMIDKIISSSQQLCRFLTNKEDFLQLNPLIPCCISIEEGLGNNDCEKLLINANTNKILAVVGTDEMNIIKLCNGKNTVREILSKNESADEEEIINFIHDLWRAKIIIFNTAMLELINK